jgi:uncharacterized repeat protein (TIGR01451 family)
MLNKHWVAACFSFWAGVATAVTPAGSTISNTAQVRFTSDGAALVVQANHQVNTDLNTAATISLYHFVSANQTGSRTEVLNPTQCFIGANATPSPVPHLLFAPAYSGSGSANFIQGPTFKGGDSVMVSVTDYGQNRNPLVAETIQVEVSSANDIEKLILTETGPSTGQFAGYLQTSRASGVHFDCQLNVSNGDQIVVKYVNTASQLVTQASALVDPIGRVFDAVTGALVNGARVTLIDNATGLPARVFADDGVTIYPSVVLTGTAVVDAAGRVTQLSAGQYRFPLVAIGSYRLQVEPPEGYRYPSALGVDAAPILKDATWRVANGSRGETFAVEFGPAVELDVPLDPRAGKLELSKAVAKTAAGYGDAVQYTIDVRNSDVLSFTGLQIVDDIPQGMRFLPGSARLYVGSSASAEKPSNPVVSRAGQRLVFDLAGTQALGASASIAPRSQIRLSYVLQVTPAAKPGRLVNTAFATYSGGVSNSANASLMLKDELLSTNAILLGRVWSSCNERSGRAIAGARIQLEDGRFAITDSQGAWHMESVTAGGHVVQIDRQSLPKGAQLENCDSTTRSANAQTVYLRAGTIRRVDFAVRLPEHTTLAAVLTPQVTRVIATDTAAPELAADFWAKATAEPRFLFPAKGFLPMTPALGVSFAHGTQQSAELWLNNTKVSGFHFEGTKTQQDAAVSFWRAVPLVEGENRLSMRVYGPGNVLITQVEQVVDMPGVPVSARVLPEQSVLLADGNKPIVVALQLLDARGKPARRGLVGPYEVRGNFMAQVQVGDQLRDPLSGTSGNASLAVQEFVIGEQGRVDISLQPASNAGELALRFPAFETAANREIKAWVQAAQRDWILVGLAESSWMGGRMKQAMQSVSGAPGMEAEFDGGRVALYARGSVPGDFLLTLAYDTRSKTLAPDRNLAQALKPDEHYLVYGDESSVQRDGVSARKLYLRIERKQFYAMFGDFAAGLTVSELARFDRVLNGVKTQSKFMAGSVPMELTAFAAQTGQRAVRDEISSDGTSGAFRLSERRVEPGTDKLRWQVRSPYPANEIQEERVLQRFIDYRIDYDTGEVILAGFARPLSWSGNRVVLVAEYETPPTQAKDWVLGMRLGAVFERTALGDVSLGGSLLHDGTQGKRGQVAGADAQLVLGPNDRVKLELAHSRSVVLDQATGISSVQQAGAYSAEYLHKSAQLEARLYARHAAEQFGIKSQLGVEQGTTRVGGQMRYRLSEQSAISSEAVARETADTKLVTSDARFEQQYKTWGWNAGARSNHGVTSADTSDSTQALFGANVQSEDRRLSLRAEAATTVAGQAFSGAPDRYVLGWDYALSQQTSLLLEQQWFKTKTDHAEISRAGLRFTPQWGGEWSVGLGQASTSMAGNALAADSRPLMSLGFQQRWALNEHWSANLGLQRQRWAGADALLQVAPAGSSASTLDNFTSAAAGLQFSRGQWQLATTLEARWGDILRRSNVGVSAYRKLSEGVAMAGGLSVKNVSEAGVNTREINARFAQAWRAPTSPWSVLQRLDWTGSQTDSTANAIGNSQTVINNFHVNYRERELGEVSLHHGLKYQNQIVLDSPYKGFTNFLMIEARKDLLPKVDAGVHVFGAHHLGSHIGSRGYGADIGITLTEGTRLTLGWNRRGLRDGVYNEASWSRAGFYVRLQMRFDETSFRNKADASLAR